MTYQLRQSDDETFYYLISIDAEGNQAVLAHETDLDEIRKHPHAKGLSVVKEADTRGVVETPPEDK